MGLPMRSLPVPGAICPGLLRILIFADEDHCSPGFDILGTGKVPNMNMVQTCWSCHKKDMMQDGFGWLSPAYNLMSWALSCLQLRKYYSRLELHTDSHAARMLIDKLQLPYTEAHCDLDGLEGYDPQLWALSKIHTYSVQEAPFLHIDGDVFIWKPLDQDLLKRGLIAQNEEADTAYYSNVISHLRTCLSFFPEEMASGTDAGAPVRSYNAGIIGGSDLPFFREYCRKAFEFVDKNAGQLHQINRRDFNAV